MQLDYLREFLAVAEYGSITAAAEALGSTQPNVSKHLQIVEDVAGAQLFIRAKKGVEFTPEGKRAFETFSTMLREYDDFLAETHSPNGAVSGQLRLGILSAGATQYVIPYVTRFMDQYPNVDFVYKTEAPEDAIGHLATRNLDVVFYADAPVETKVEISFLHIADDPILLVVPADSPLADKEYIEPEDVNDKTLICLRIPGSTKMLNEIAFDAGYIPKHIVQVDVVELVVSHLQKSGGFFLSPKFMMKFFSSPLVVGKEPSASLSIGINFAYRSKDRNPLVSLFLQSVESQNAAMRMQGGSARNNLV